MLGKSENMYSLRLSFLSPGSIIVNFTLEIAAQTNTTMTEGLLMELFNVPQVGLLTILPESNNVSYTNDSGKKGKLNLLHLSYLCYNIFW